MTRSWYLLLAAVWLAAFLLMWNLAGCTSATPC